MIAIDKLGILATGSNDTYLRLYDLKVFVEVFKMMFIIALGFAKGAKSVSGTSKGRERSYIFQ